MVAPARKIEDATALARSAPHNMEAERQLLGAMLMNNETFFRVSDFLEAVHFYVEPHRAIYEKIGQLIRAGKVASPITLKTFYPADAQIAEMPVTQYLLRLASEATTIINAEDYGRIVHDLAVRRNLIRIGEDMVNIAFDAPIDMPPRAQIEDAERRLFELAETGRYEGGFHTFSDALRDAVDMAAAAYQRDGHLSGISTGLRDLDATMGGLQRSDLIILAARPAMGKTSLVTNIAYNVAAAYEAAEQPDGTMKTVNGGIVGFFSLEMSSEQLATRILAEQTEISSSDIRRGSIDEHQFSKLAAAAQYMQTLPLYIDHTGGISIAQLAARARRLKRQRGLDLLVVDYLQLLSGSARSQSNGRVQEITEITTGLKALAKELQVPIVALSQLSRQVENRDDKRPQLADLRESGSIEQDADVVVFIYRDEYYMQGRKPKEGTEEFFKWQAEFEQVRGKAEVIIGKQRHGPTGTVQLAFHAQFTRFADLAREDYLPERME
ncbi:replicative DNA helicase [Oharaeibacter diazotrophicus]|uniref:Replicative DNA helicase n=1 Tax=Oharaeibacter diazotrophicus TaxID=1920512 RepID=A0A4R6RJP6_9HYPH|nr:replicative DNA helicase [Oharaeibacter diazotrophicus]TDP86700.1 replicative DNA helicase [Oharaeibacter diazotrophicus]BBE71358.1 replicative DNA helicase [Pleomorphomonas sp. SM30]GLS78113.1 replicative DNA helicase [Oharaeibacter diazotrophicus]